MQARKKGTPITEEQKRVVKGPAGFRGTKPKENKKDKSKSKGKKEQKALPPAPPKEDWGKGVDAPKPKLAKLTFSAKAWLKMNWFRDRGNHEIAAMGLASATDPLYVEDIYVLPQECSPAFVEFDDDALADHMEKMLFEHQIGPERCMRIWCHTHPGNSAHPSSVDEATLLSKFGHCDYAVMFILAKGGQTTCRLRMVAHGIAMEDEINVFVDWNSVPEEGIHIDPADLNAIYDECCTIKQVGIKKDHTSHSTHSNYYHGGSSGGCTQGRSYPKDDPAPIVEDYYADDDNETIVALLQGGVGVPELLGSFATDGDISSLAVLTEEEMTELWGEMPEEQRDKFVEAYRERQDLLERWIEEFSDDDDSLSAELDRDLEERLLAAESEEEAQRLMNSRDEAYNNADPSLFNPEEEEENIPDAPKIGVSDGEEA